MKAALAALLRAIGMGSTPADLTHLLRYPALLLQAPEPTHVKGAAMA
jgi:hypothetical protein